MTAYTKTSRFFRKAAPLLSIAAVSVAVIAGFIIYQVRTDPRLSLDLLRQGLLSHNGLLVSLTLDSDESIRRSLEDLGDAAPAISRGGQATDLKGLQVAVAGMLQSWGTKKAKASDADVIPPWAHLGMLMRRDPLKVNDIVVNSGQQMHLLDVEQAAEDATCHVRLVHESLAYNLNIHLRRGLIFWKVVGVTGARPLFEALAMRPQTTIGQSKP